MTTNPGTREHKVLVTGGGGFIGRHCLPLLTQHFEEVHSVTSGRVPDEESDVCWHHADLLEPQQLDTVVAKVRPSHLLHLAWVTGHHSYWTSADNFRWLEATLALGRAFAACGGRRMVTVGSCAEYSWQYGHCCEGLTPLEPASPYCTCKHAARMALASLARETGISFASTRVFHLYGPHEQSVRLVPSIIRPLLEGNVARATSGEQIRDFVYIKDAAAAHVRLLTSDVQGPVNVASGQAVKVKEVALAIGALLGCADKIHFGALPPRAGEPAVLTADTARLRQELGCRPAYDLQQGLSETIQWWKQFEAPRCMPCAPAPFVAAVQPANS